MRINVLSDTGKSCISDVTENNGLIKWNFESEVDYLLIVKAGFSEEIDIEEVSGSISEIKIGEEYQIDSTKLCVLERRQHGAMAARRAKYAPAVYAIFGCNYDQNSDTLTVIKEPNSWNECVVSTSVEYRMEDEIVEEKIKKGFLSKEIVVKHFSRLTLNKIFSYTDGDIFYTYEGCKYKYPITNEMLGKQLILKWYKNEKRPVLQSAVAGYKLKKL